ncbi:hypothetical protein JOQ06_005075, partial [Pogonophryne albipinna]
INIGMMSPQGVDLKPRRGKTLPLFTDPEVAAPAILERAVQKMKAFNKDMDEGPYVLLYPDCSEVVNVPGSEKPFTLAEYKKDLGKAYARITLFICLEKHFRGGDDTSDSDSDIVITSRSTAEFNQADTVVFEFEPRNKSTPKHKPENEGKALGHSSTTQPGQINIGMMSPQGVDLKPRRGKTLPLFTDPEVAAPAILERAVQKMKAFNKDMDEGPYVLLYPDCSEVVNVPGSEKPFTLAEYKKDLGKAYARITLFICLEKHFRGGDDTSDSDSDIVITSRSTAEFNQADTVINIGMMSPQGVDLKPRRGKTLPLFTDPEVAAPAILERAVQKMKAFNKDMDEGPYVLLYPDCSEVVNVPGSEKPFTLAEYKKDLGKAYARITLFICLEKHFRGGDDTSDSDSDIVITSRSTAEFNQADTVVFEFEPRNKSTPKHKPENEGKALGHSSTTQPGQINIGMMSPQGVDLKPRRGKTLPLFTDPEVAAPAILERAVQKMKAFNKDMDEGPYVLLYPDCSEVVNVPGSEKPFTLAEYKKDLGKAYARITLFICLEKHFRGGDDTSDSDSDIVITSRSTAEFNQADTVVFEFEPRNKSTPKHKPENEGKALGHSSTTQPGQIENAASVDALREMTMRHSTMLQTAGCLRHVASVEGKKGIVSDYLQWYIIGRNSSVIDRTSLQMNRYHNHLDTSQGKE